MCSAVAEASYIINVHISVIAHISKYIFHDLLSEVRRALQSHRQSIVFVLAKWSYDSAEVLAFIIELERIVLHTNVKLREELVALTFT